MADLRDFTGKNRVFTGAAGIRVSDDGLSNSDRVDDKGRIRFNDATDLMEYYTGTEWKSIDSPPQITFFTIDGGSDVTSANIDPSTSGNATIQIKGSLFDTTGAAVTFVGTSETLSPVSTTRNSSNLLTVTVARSDFDNTNEPYTIKVTNGSGLSAELSGAINADRALTFTNAANTNFDIFDSTRGSVSIAAGDLAGATDPDNDSITYSISAGALPSGLTLTSSTGAIAGNTDAVGTDTVSTFTVSAATDNLTITRQFTITQKAPAITTYTSGSGNFSVPTGVTAVDVLVVAGGGEGGTGIPNNVSVGGGGAGGLIYRPGFTVSPGGTVAYAVGAGGSGTGSPPESGDSGSDSTFGTLTAKGGGGGGWWDGNPGHPGGSGGGGSSGQNTIGGGGSATQPTQPGDSGTYGFGNAGGGGGPTWNNGNPGGPNTRGGGGGGAGGAGQPGNNPGAGGAGKSYSISGSTVAYAGGGGGGAGQGPGPAQAGGGTGGSPGQNPAPNGTANRGGGGGGGGVIGQTPTTDGGDGGSGVVIISY